MNQQSGQHTDGLASESADEAPGEQAPAESQERQPAPTAGADHEVSPNYRYWRRHGEEWADEYDKRKRQQPYYHIQEVMLADYIAHHAPAKVLEFGCGVGRHLQNMSEISGIEVYGYDQSQTMVDQCLRWASQTWIDECVVVGEPTGRLPYADGEFDIVFTAEVLLHTRPEDINGILAELIRVCRGHVLHLEPGDTYELVFEEHDGCWKHDLVAAYARLGRHCELLPSGFAAQRPFRVAVGEQPSRYTWSPLVLSLFRRMEQDMNRGGSELRAQVAEVLAEVQTKEQRRQELECTAAEQCAKLDQQVRTLNEHVAATAQERERQRKQVDHLLREQDLFLFRANQLLEG